MFRIVLITAIVLSPTFAQDFQRGVSRPPTPALAASAGPYYALIIGVNDYIAQPKLKTAVSDAMSLETELRDNYRFQTRLLLNEKATRVAILRALSDYRELHAGDNLLIYYAGHGYRDAAADSAYWLPVDSDSTPGNWISADDIARAVRAIPARHVLVVSDSCYSGDVAGREPHVVNNPDDHRVYLQRMLASKSRTFLASGGDEPVADGGANGHSVFTGAVLKGLRAQEGTAFSAENLFQWYLQEQVAGNSRQTPHFAAMRDSGHEQGDFVFVGSGGVEAVVRDPGLRTDDGSTLATQVEIAYWGGVDKSDAESLRLYVKRYPRGQFIEIAERDLARLQPPAQGSESRGAPTGNTAPVPGKTNPDNSSPVRPTNLRADLAYLGRIAREHRLLELRGQRDGDGHFASTFVVTGATFCWVGTDGNVRLKCEFPVAGLSVEDLLTTAKQALPELTWHNSAGTNLDRLMGILDDYDGKDATLTCYLSRSADMLIDFWFSQR